MNDSTTDAANFLAPLWKRKWLILAVAILVAAGTYYYYKHKPYVFLAKTQLFLGNANEQAAATGAAPGKTTLTGRALADQVEFINSSVIGLEVRKRLKAEHPPNIAAARGKAKATASPSSDFIAITTEAHKPKAAVALANMYAAVYVERQRSNYQRGIQAAIANAKQQLRRLENPPSVPKGKANSGSATIQEATLASKINELEASLGGTSGVQQVSPAKANPLPVSPTPKKNAIFGGILGLLLACVAAYVLGRFNRRLSSLNQVEEAFQTQILTALPKVRNPVMRPDGTRAPARPLLEPLRRLHTTLESAGTLGGGAGGAPRSVLFMSAEPGDGRSSLVANLARVQNDAGARVAVVEADFRRPVQAKIFGTDDARGLAGVLSGSMTLSQALHTIPATGAPEPGPAAPAPVNDERNGASLVLLPSGGQVDNPPALLGGPVMRSLLRTLTEEYDHVLIDAPALLEVGDAIPLLAQVDGIVLVARIGHTRDFSAERLLYTLGRTVSTPVLGVVANCASRKDAERYGFTWTAPAQRAQPKLIRR
jgi:Mrp family chromosome partitioning ATPase/capsular polysaccharide biosynthesis protein